MLGLGALLAKVAHRRWLVLSGWAAVSCAAGHVGGSGLGWHYFVTGSDVLASSQGLHLYAAHDQLQSGPLTFALVVPLTKLLPAKAAEIAGIAIMTAIGVLLLWIIERTCMPQPLIDRAKVRVLIAGLPVLAVWAEVATHWTHPDDVLALAGVFAALYLFRQQRCLPAALLLALAVDAKPWALLFAPMLLLAERRARLRATAVFAAVVLLAWLPFVVADPASLHAGQFRIPVSSASVLHLFGVGGGTPSWCRPAQIVLGAIAVAIAIRRRRWYAVVLVGICARLLLDPATKNYYESGLLAASALYDLASIDLVMPVMSMTALTLMWLPSYVLTAFPLERAGLRLAFLIMAPCLALVTATAPRNRRQAIGLARAAGDRQDDP